MQKRRISSALFFHRNNIEAHIADQSDQSDRNAKQLSEFAAIDNITVKHLVGIAVVRRRRSAMTAQERDERYRP